MSYNLKKSSQKQNEVRPYSATLPAHNEEYKFSIEEARNVNTYLEGDRRQSKSGPQTHEAMLDAVRKDAHKTDKITEGGLAESKSPLYPHRQFANGSDKYDVTPINLISEAYDQKFREAFSAANKGADTDFWDKYQHADLDDKPTKVSINIPSAGSQLASNPQRFKNIDAFPSNADAQINRDNFGTNLNITRLHHADVSSKYKVALASLEDADKLLFAIHYKAASENRNLSEQENGIIDTVNKDKEKFLLTLATGEQDLRYRGSPEFQKELAKHDPFAADPRRSGEMDLIEGNEEILEGGEDGEGEQTEGINQGSASDSEKPIDEENLPF